MELPLIQKTMVEEFQCPGCGAGVDTSGRCFKQAEDSLACANHSAGIYAAGIGNINIGLPLGFNRRGNINKEVERTNIRLFASFDDNFYNKFNVPVWAMEHEGYLLVRCFAPRINFTTVDVFKDGTIADLRKLFPAVIDVAEFKSEID